MAGAGCTTSIAVLLSAVVSSGILVKVLLAVAVASGSVSILVWCTGVVIYSETGAKDEMSSSISFKKSLIKVTKTIFIENDRGQGESVKNLRLGFVVESGFTFQNAVHPICVSGWRIAIGTEPHAVVGAELCSNEGLDTCPVISSIERYYDGVLAVNKGEEQDPILGSCSEGFEDEHCSIGENILGTENAKNFSASAESMDIIFPIGIFDLNADDFSLNSVLVSLQQTSYSVND
uniref:Uncharacterized protein n=1 Tax=Romanomermis culicivorax TaxID=13658 RepID=A0A915JG68_ROMCU